MSPDLIGLVDRLKDVTSANEAALSFLDFGLQAGACSVNTFFGSDYREQVATTYPDWWVNRTTKEKVHHDSMHMVREVRRGILPRVDAGIDICIKNPNATEAGLKRTFEMWDHFGVRSACAFPMPDPDGKYRGAGMGLGFEDPLDAYETRMAETGGTLAVAAFTAFTKMSLLKHRVPGKNPLSPRQKEVLLRFSQGKQITAIADDLGISESAVNLYLQNLKRKLEVRTREQALAQAILKGWIEP